jgi:hypothetical protein
MGIYPPPKLGQLRRRNVRFVLKADIVAAQSFHFFYVACPPGLVEKRFGRDKRAWMRYDCDVFANADDAHLTDG